MPALGPCLLIAPCLPKSPAAACNLPIGQIAVPDPVSVGATSCFPSFQHVLRLQDDSTVAKSPVIRAMCCPIVLPHSAASQLRCKASCWGLSCKRDPQRSPCVVAPLPPLSLLPFGPGTGHLKWDGEVFEDGSEHRSAAKQLIHL